MFVQVQMNKRQKEKKKQVSEEEGMKRMQNLKEKKNSQNQYKNVRGSWRDTDNEGGGKNINGVGTASASGQGKQNKWGTKRKSKHEFKSFKKGKGGDEYINLLLKA